MAKYRGPVCKLCRREGEKLFLKGERCFTPKCAFERRGYPPGQHGKSAQFRRRRESDYNRQLRAKQKARRVYGILEKQFRRYFNNAEREKGVTGENLLKLLEIRLDNVVYRSGLASSRAEARQFVLHNHFLVNDRKVNIPSFSTKPGDIIVLKEKSRDISRITDSVDFVQQRGIPDWLDFDLDKMQVTVKSIPTRDQVTEDVQEQLIVELYSK